MFVRLYVIRSKTESKFEETKAISNIHIADLDKFIKGNRQ